MSEEKKTGRIFRADYNNSKIEVGVFPLDKALEIKQKLEKKPQNINVWVEPVEEQTVGKQDSSQKITQ